MRDLAVVDRQLAELQQQAPDVRALLGRILGSDRSLARLNEMLDSLGGGTGVGPRPAAQLRDPLAPVQRLSQRPPARTASPGGEQRAARDDASGDPRSAPRSDPPPAAVRPNPPGVRGSLPPRIVSPLAPVQGDGPKALTPWPPVVAGRSARDTLVDAAVPPPATTKVDGVELDAATAALFGITSAPAPASGAPEPEVPPAAPVPAEEAPSEERPSQRTRSNTLQGIAGVDPWLPPPGQPEPAAEPASAAAPEADARDSRPSRRELLERELDPRDFPSSHPPRARSLPPPLPRGEAAVVAIPAPTPAVPQDGFEMLIDDEAEDDIMEIDDVELEEIE